MSKCQALLERADSSYSQLLAATTLAKLLSRYNILHLKLFSVSVSCFVPLVILLWNTTSVPVIAQCLIVKTFGNYIFLIFFDLVTGQKRDV